MSSTKHPKTCACKGDGVLLVVRPCPSGEAGSNTREAQLSSSQGGPEIKYFMGESPKPKKSLSAEQFYTRADATEPWNDMLSYECNDFGRARIFWFAEAYADSRERRYKEVLCRIKKCVDFAEFIDLKAEISRILGNQI
jgi:hypothetical protein